MNVFLTILQGIAPLYLIIALGFVAGKYARVDRASVATLIFYFISPVVFFASVAKVQVDVGVIALPIIMFGISTALCLGALWAAKKFWRDDTPNILALSSGTANTGYFGLPVALMLFDEHALGMYFAAMLGMAVYESSVGYYVTARGRHTPREALRKVARLPVLYAFLAGLAASLLGLHLPQPLEQLATHFRGAYVVLGMMIVGLGLSTVKRLSLDVKFTGFAFAVKYAVWPVVVLALVALDNALLHFLGTEEHRIMLLLAVVPMAANSVVFATLLDAHPEKVATAVLLSTLLGLIYVPLMVSLLLS